MAWTMLVSADDPELTVKDDGNMEWNMVLQRKLGDPKWVEILYEPDEGWLGVRANWITEGIEVEADLTGNEYKIYSGDILEDEGVSVDDTFSDTAVKTAEAVANVEGALYNAEPIWYITLP